MKTLLNPSRTLFLLAATLGLSFTQLTPARAADGKPATTEDKPVIVRVDKVDTHTYLVRVSNPSQKWSQVHLVPAGGGAELYRSGDVAPSYGRKLNLKNLEDGQYDLFVKTDKTTSRYTINIQTQSRQRTFEVSENAVAAR